MINQVNDMSGRTAMGPYRDGFLYEANIINNGPILIFLFTPQQFIV